METLGTNPAAPSRKVEAPRRNRRRRLRHRVHTPAYAALNHSCEDRSVELNEVLNISEDGLAMQSSTELQLDETVKLCLDLSETGTKIDTSGKVVWLDSGRVGISFAEMPQEPRRQLQEWLFINTVLACVYHEAEQESHTVATALAAATTSAPFEGNFPADYTSTLAALSAVEREVLGLRGMLDLALRLVAERAIAFTHATGAAIALSDGVDMICNATAGPDAPPLGLRLKIGHGFSGECVRTGKILRCEDADTDPLADKETCRALGIRSMIAVPIRWRESIIGLLEVFSGRRAAFRTNDEVVLKRLAEIVAEAVHRAGSEDAKTQPASQPTTDDDVYAEAPLISTLPQLSRTRKFLLIAAAVTLIAAVAWLIQPWKTSADAAGQRSTIQQPKEPDVSSTDGVGNPQDFSDIRQLADRGDATAEFAVGAHYATGEDVSQDYAEAARWFEKAAEQGHVGAQATLGAYYWSGRGVAQDLVKAYFWAVLAQTGGDDASKYRVAFLSSRMTRNQILQAQQQANEWIKSHGSALSSQTVSHPK